MPLISSWGLQLAVAPALVGLIVGGVGGLVLSLVMPILVPAAYLRLILTGGPSAVVAQQDLAIGLGLLAGMALAILLGLRGLIRYAPIATILTAAMATLAIAEIQASHRVAARADELGALCLSQRSFLASVAQTSSRPRFHHAEALIGGAWHHWSYKADDFRITPEETWPAPWQRDCQERAAWHREGGRP